MPPKAFAHRRAGSPQEAGQWDRRHVLATDLRAVGGRAYPRVTAMARDRSHIVFELGMPFLTTTAFVYVYRALQAPQQYVGFVVLGDVWDIQPRALEMRTGDFLDSREWLALDWAELREVLGRNLGDPR